MIAAAALALLIAPQQPSLGDVVVTGDVRTAQALLARVDVNEPDEEGLTALMRAASAGRGDMVRLLVTKGAHVDVRSAGGVTPLMMAAVAGYTDAIRALLSAKADPNAKDNQGRTPLMAAASSGEAGAIDALLKAGADVAAQDASGGTALTYAAGEGHPDAMMALQKGGAKPTATEVVLASARCHTPVVRTFLAAGLPVDATMGSTTALHAAAGANCAETAKLLIERGANLDAKNNDGWTPLMKAAAAGHVEVVRVLLDGGADMTVADANGRTAWMYAAMAGRMEMGELFRAKRAQSAALIVESPVLRNDEPIARDYTADGHNWSPPLTWTGGPDATKSFAVVCEDPDAGNPPPFVHWVIYNIPAAASGLPENIPFEPGAPMPPEIAGAVHGLSGFRRPFYRGPAPPPGKPHHYHFIVYALDVADLRPGLTRAELLDAIKGHVLKQGELVAIYERTP